MDEFEEEFDETEDEIDEIGIATGYAGDCGEIIMEDLKLSKKDLLEKLKDESENFNKSKVYEIIRDNYNNFIEDNPDFTDINIRDFIQLIRNTLNK